MIKPAENSHRLEDIVDSDAFVEELRNELEEEYPDLENEARNDKFDGPALLTQTEEFFAPDGPLKLSEQYGGRPYEYRQQQADMAAKTAEALAGQFNLCVEAPTGVGKSFAYLIPMIHYSKMMPRPIIISTETINLQEQLIDKDIPLLKKLTGIEFRAALAKGRSNYLCLRRLGFATGEHRDQYLPVASLALEMERIAKWSEDSTANGERDSIDFRIDPVSWGYVCCEAGNCLGPGCGFFRKCFYWRARLKWEDAHIIVANHALFFTDLKMKYIEGLDTSLLPQYSAVVIDEAHTLENNAAEYLGLRVNSMGMISFLNRLYNPDNAKGLLLRKGDEALHLRKLVATVKQAVNVFFSLVEQFLLEHNDSIRRVRQPGQFPDTITPKLTELRNHLTEYIKMQEDKDLKVELQANLQRCNFYIDGIDAYINMSLEESVYWVEEERAGVSLQASPLNIPLLLEKVLFKRRFPVTLTSATLTVRQSFDYYRGRIGFINGAELRLDSPFSHDQVKVYIPRDMPEPNNEKYSSALLEQIPRFLDLTHGKAFVLFTSYRTLRHCADNLQDYFDERELNLMIQGESMTRSAMLREFKKDVDSVIFGTNSFWTGVDVPGEALSNVIVTKFPFAVPSHPLIEARCETLEAAGKSSFMDYSLPEAVLKFRQGVGRLIRSRADTGVIVILDHRVVSKRYGRYFIDSLPGYPVEFV